MEHGEADLEQIIKSLKEKKNFTVSKMKYYWEQMLEAVGKICGAFKYMTDLHCLYTGCFLEIDYWLMLCLVGLHLSQKSIWILNCCYGIQIKKTLVPDRILPQF